ncbi:MAG: hypothetical protein AABX50_01720 [Nanoarchaeota archaeon]
MAVFWPFIKPGVSWLMRMVGVDALAEGIKYISKGFRSRRNSGIRRGLPVAPPIYVPPPSTYTGRRNLWSSLRRPKYAIPLAIGVAGVTYGALRGMSKYLTHREIKKLKDRDTDYQEKIELLGRYKEGVQRDLDSKEGRIDYLERRLENVNRQLRLLRSKSGRLEEVAGDSFEEDGEPNYSAAFLIIIPIIIGWIGILISIFLSTMALTGNVIINKSINQEFSIGIVIFIASLLIILFGIKREERIKNQRRKKIKSRKT